MDRKRVAAMLGVPENLTPDGRHRLSREDVDTKPYLRWNCFVDLVSVPPDSLPVGARRCAALALLYESEVQNGGHDQYFDNTGCKYIDETVRALTQLGDHCRTRVLAEAHKTFELAKGDLEAFDQAFHNCKPALPEILEAHLAENESEYIEWAG